MPIGTGFGEGVEEAGEVRGLPRSGSYVLFVVDAGGAQEPCAGRAGLAAVGGGGSGGGSGGGEFADVGVCRAGWGGWWRI